MCKRCAGLLVKEKEMMLVESLCVYVYVCICNLSGLFEYILLGHIFLGQKTELVSCLVWHDFNGTPLNVVKK